MTELETRVAIVAAARDWLRTPYHHEGRVKGAGADCVMLLIDVYAGLGLIADVDPRPYPHDWHLHRSEERYLKGVLDHATEIEGPPAPGDVALFQFGRCFAHGAIVTAWPHVIHAYIGEGVVMADASRHPLAGRAAKFYSLFEGDRS